MLTLLNSLIQHIDSIGLSQIVFYAFHVLTFLAGVSISIYYGKKMGINAIKSALLVVFGFSLSYAFMLVFYWVQTGFRSFGGQNNATVFIYFPLFYRLPAKIMKIDLDKQCSILTVGAPLTQAVGHIGCIFPGCCEGYPVPWGIYNVRLDEYVFPNQLLEALVAFAITFFFIWKDRKRNFIPDMKNYPTMLIMYGSTRFALEFLRNNRKILFGCSPVSFHALFMVLVGVVAIIVLNKRQMLKNEVKAA